MDIFTAAGIAGAALLVVAYFASQQGWLRATDPLFPVSNLLGSLLILVSLWIDWNLPSVIIEGFWCAISLYGLVLALRRRSR